MYPLLVNAVAATASTLIDRWAQSRAPKAAMPAVPFQQMLDGVASARQSTATMIDRFRGELLLSPEVRTALDSSDPSHPVALQLLADGTVTAQSPGYAAKALALSPDTATVARKLAAMLPANAVFPLSR